MKAFTVDGSVRNFADVIIDNAVTFESCVVMSYGFGVKQVTRLVNSFGDVLLVADESHSTLNENAYKSVVALARELEHFRFETRKTHAKFALVDGVTAIFTSANLSANQRTEMYFVCDASDVNGLGEIMEDIGIAQKAGSSTKEEYSPDIKRCKSCNKILERKRNGRKLESTRDFKRRKFCDKVCAGKYRDGQSNAEKTEIEKAVECINNSDGEGLLSGLEVLQQIANNPKIDSVTRVNAAKAMLPYQKKKISEGIGKKDEKAKKASDVAGGNRFGAAPPPKVIGSIGRK